MTIDVAMILCKTLPELVFSSSFQSFKSLSWILLLLETHVFFSSLVSEPFSVRWVVDY